MWFFSQISHPAGPKLYKLVPNSTKPSRPTKFDSRGKKFRLEAGRRVFPVKFRARTILKAVGYISGGGAITRRGGKHKLS